MKCYVLKFIFYLLTAEQNEQQMSKSSKKELYDKILVPTMTYGSGVELSVRSLQREKKVILFKMTCLRSIVDLTRGDKINIIYIYIFF